MEHFYVGWDVVANLFVMSDSHVDAVILQRGGEGGHVRLSVVIGEEHLRLDDACRLDELVGCHRVGLVARQEGDVDVVDVSHLGDVLRVSGDVDAQAVEVEDVAVVTSFRVELRASLRCVVGRNSLHFDAEVQVFLVAIFQDESIALHVGTAAVGDETCTHLRELLDGILVVVVAMLVGDEDEVSLRHARVVDGAVAHLGHGVDIQFQTAKLDADARMHQRMQLHFLSAFRLEGVHLSLLRGLAACRQTQCQHRNAQCYHFVHVVRDLVCACKCTDYLRTTKEIRQKNISYHFSCAISLFNRPHAMCG